MTGEWQYPLGITYGNQKTASAIITPKIKVTGIEGSDRTEDIPNRDAADFRLDEANMFLANRFQGRDFILPGSHVAAGVSGITESSFLGDVSTVSWSARADRKSFELNESRANAVYDNNGTFVEVSHTQVAESYFTNSAQDREEVSINVTQDLGRGLSLTAEQVWNLSEGQSKKDQSILLLGWSGGFQDCVKLSLEYKRDPYADRDIQKVSELQLRVSFKYLGSISQ